MIRKISMVSPDARVDAAMVGPDWFGLIYFRLYANEESWMTFRGFKILWFNIVFKLPAPIENWLGNVKRDPW